MTDHDPPIAAAAPPAGSSQAATSAPPALDIEGLGVAYGTTAVLTDLSLTVPARSISAVLGSSGSGKTTLLRVIAGFERCRAGRILLAGEVVESPDRHVPPERRRLGYVAQDGALFPHLSVAGNVGYAFGRSRTRHARSGTRHGRSGTPSGRRSKGSADRRSERVGELLELVGLPGMERRYPHELSGGQQQRVALARALALEPSVVLLDEPFSALDAALRASVREDVVAVLRAAGTSVVLVTHDQTEALSVADEVAVLRDGRIAQVGDPRDIYAHPADPAMAAFLGEANTLHVPVTDHVVDTPLGRLRTPAVAAGPAVVVVRPEEIDLLPGEQGQGLFGEVSALSYQGYASLVTVEAEVGRSRLTLRVRTQRSGAAVAVGDRVTLRASGDVAAWPDTGAGAGNDAGTDA